MLRYVNADKVDEQIFDEVVKILSNPSKFAKSWYRDQGVMNWNLKLKD